MYIIFDINAILSPLSFEKAGIDEKNIQSHTIFQISAAFKKTVASINIKHKFLSDETFNIIIFWNYTLLLPVY